MIKQLAKCIREYKTAVILTLIFIVGEVVIETAIPYITANLVNGIKNGIGINEILKSGGILAIMAVLSLACGGIAGLTSAKASAGFAKNLRKDMFSNIQTFSFADVDPVSRTGAYTSRS